MNNTNDALVGMLIGSSPDFTDTSKKAQNESGGVSCQNAGNSATSSSEKRLS